MRSLQCGGTLRKPLQISAVPRQQFLTCRQHRDEKGAAAAGRRSEVAKPQPVIHPFLLDNARDHDQFNSTFHEEGGDLGKQPAGDERLAIAGIDRQKPYFRDRAVLRHQFFEPWTPLLDGERRGRVDAHQPEDLAVAFGHEILVLGVELVDQQPALAHRVLAEFRGKDLVVEPEDPLAIIAGRPAIHHA